MCRVKRKTYIHSDGRREVIESRRLCHNAIGSNTCTYTVYENIDARVVEARPPSNRSSTSGDSLLVGRDGLPRPYRTLGRRISNRTPSARTSMSREHSPADSVSGPASQPKHKEVRPSAPTLPGLTTSFPSARYPDPFSPTSPPDPRRTVAQENTAIYERPPSLEMPRADINERPYVPRRRSGAAPAREDLSEPITPPRRESFRRRRPSRVTIDVGADMSDSARGPQSSPGLSDLPRFGHARNDSANPRRSRSDSIRADEELARRLQEAEDHQAQVERDRLAASETRQQARESRTARHHRDSDADRRARLDETERKDRLRRSIQAEDAARARAAELELEREESSRERKERKRREAAAAAQTKDRRTSIAVDADLQRRIDADLAQMARERADANVRRYYDTHAPVSPTLSARTFPPARLAPPYSVAVHNPPVPGAGGPLPSARRSSTLLERGDAVIAPERARGAREEMREAMAGMQLDGEDALSGWRWGRERDQGFF